MTYKTHMYTPLHATHLALGARMAPFAGWDMPIQYDGIVAEHLHTRSHVSVFDTCHMGEFEFRGSSAETDLERLVTCRVSTLRDGQVRYGYLLNPAGGVLDDITVFRRAPDHFFMVVNAGTRESDAAWIREHLCPGTRFADHSPHRAKLDVQGPAAKGAIEAALDCAIPVLGYFRFADCTVGGVPCTLSRTGYTGEWGYEIYFDCQHAVDLWNRLTAPGEIKPAGLGARDTLRLEVGYPLYGHELSDATTPVTAGGMFIDRKKEFIGKAAVERDFTEGVPRILAGLRLKTKRAAREGDLVFADGKEAGIVTSGSLAPSLGVAIAFAYLDTPYAGKGQQVTVEVRGKQLDATVVDIPFYTAGTARLRVPDAF